MYKSRQLAKTVVNNECFPDCATGPDSTSRNSVALAKFGRSTAWIFQDHSSYPNRAIPRVVLQNGIEAHVMPRSLLRKAKHDDGDHAVMWEQVPREKFELIEAVAERIVKTVVETDGCKLLAS